MKLHRCPCELSICCKTPILTYRGATNPRIIVIGSSPSIQDDKTGILFSGADGRKITELFRKTGVNLKDVGFTNVVSCYPNIPKNKPKKVHILSCSNVLEKTIKKHSKRLELVILLGNLAVKTILQKTGMDKIAGKVYRVGGIYHLALHDSNKKMSEGKIKQEERDLQKALALVNLNVDEVINWEMVDAKRLEELLPEFNKSKMITFDVETSSTDMNDPIQFIIGIGFCYDTKKRKGCFVPLEHFEVKITKEEYDKRIELIRKIMLNPVGKQGFNGGFDMSWLYKVLDIDINKINYVSDSMHEYHFVCETARGGSLENLSLDYLPDMAGYDAEVGVLKVEHGVKFSMFPLDKIARYCVGDCIATARLSSELFDKQLKKEGSWDLYRNTLIPAVPIYAIMSMNGMKLDIDYCKTIQKAYGEKVLELKAECNDLTIAKIDVTKPAQVVKYCYTTLGLPEQTEMTVNSKGVRVYSPSIGKKAIETLLNSELVREDNKNFLKKYREYRTVNTADTRYAQKWSTWLGKDGLVHPSYWLAGTKTGRISTTNPNFAQLSNSESNTRTNTEKFLNKYPIRRMVISRFKNGKILEVDYSQLELRLVGMVSKDKVMTSTYRDGLNDGDLHLSAAKVKFPDFDIVREEVQKQYRTQAKEVNFKGIYSLSEEFLATYLGAKEYTEKVTNNAVVDGFVTNLFGRRRRIPNLLLPVPKKETYKMNPKEKDNFYKRLSAIRQACNFTIQSLGHDLMIKGLLNVYDRLLKGNYKSKLVLEIHDALVVDSPEDEAFEVLVLMKEEMEKVILDCEWSNGIPLRADMEIGDNLEDLVSYKT